MSTKRKVLYIISLALFAIFIFANVFVRVKIQDLTKPVNTIYSSSGRKSMRQIIDDLYGNSKKASQRSYDDYDPFEGIFDDDKNSDSSYSFSYSFGSGADRSSESGSSTADSDWSSDTDSGSEYDTPKSRLTLADVLLVGVPGIALIVLLVIITLDAAGAERKAYEQGAEGTSDLAPGMKGLLLRLASVGPCFAAYAVFFVVSAWFIGTFPAIFAPEFYSEYNGYFSLAQTMFGAYLLGVPFIMLLSMSIPAVEITKRSLTFGQWLVYLFMGAALMLAGTLMGSPIHSILTTPFADADISPLSSALLSVDPFTRILVVGIGAPIFEELVFRKFLIDRTLKYGEVVSVVTSGIFFGLLHGNFQQFFFAMFLGFLLAFIYIRTGKIIYTMGIHFAINMSNAVITTPITMELLKSMDDVYNNPMKVAPLILGLYAWIFALLGFAIAGIVLLIKKRRTLKLVPSPIMVMVKTRVKPVRPVQQPVYAQQMPYGQAPVYGQAAYAQAPVYGQAPVAPVYGQMPMTPGYGHTPVSPAFGQSTMAPGYVQPPYAQVPQVPPMQPQPGYAQPQPAQPYTAATQQQQMYAAAPAQQFAASTQPYAAPAQPAPTQQSQMYAAPVQQPAPPMQPQPGYAQPQPAQPYTAPVTSPHGYAIPPVYQNNNTNPNLNPKQGLRPGQIIEIMSPLTVKKFIGILLHNPEIWLYITATLTVFIDSYLPDIIAFIIRLGNHA